MGVIFRDGVSSISLNFLLFAVQQLLD